jgi:[protein-PII] uridylyltransferase
VNIKDAELMETKDGKVLEVFKILDANDEPLVEHTRIQRVLKQVENVVQKGAQKTKLPVSRKVTHFDGEPMVEFLNTPKRNRSLLKVSTLNNPIYMEKICAVFRSRNLLLHSAKISALGETLESVFLLSHQDGESLNTAIKGTVVEELTTQIA